MTRNHVIEKIRECNKPHANSYQVCAYAQTGRGGCGACRLATVYRSLNVEKGFAPPGSFRPSR